MVEEVNKETKGKLCLFGGLSGCGKTWLHEELVRQRPDKYKRSPNSTTRDERPEERKKRLKLGIISYTHLAVEEFMAKIKTKELFGQVNFCGNWYAMSRSAIEAVWAEGKTAVNDCQTEGIKAAKQEYGSNCITFFVTPHKDDDEALRISALRLCRRTAGELLALDREAKDFPERKAEIEKKIAIKKANFKERLEDNKKYILLKDLFDYTVINEEGKGAEAVERAERIIEDEKNKSNSFTNSQKEDTLQAGRVSDEQTKC